MIRRGEATWIPSVGYHRTPEDGIEMTPDLQLQDAIRGVFVEFQELGSARQVLLWYRQEQSLLLAVGYHTSGYELMETWLSLKISLPKGRGSV